MEPVLVIMAAGMGSRFGGLKQMTPVDNEGCFILDYSVYDAIRAGFRKIVCVIKKELESDFRATIGARLSSACELRYAFQRLDDLPEGFSLPEDRQKPWGTAHAVWAARELIDGPFAVINADDFYGQGAFKALYDFLAGAGDEHTHALIAYKLRNTLTENGTVARGVCTADSEGNLLTVTEHTCIQGPAHAPSHSEDGGSTWLTLDPDAPVSLNTWGFRKSFLDAIGSRWGRFLAKTMPQNPAKAEFFLPGVVNECLAAGTDRVTLLHTDDVWHGVTYREDLPALQEALAQMRNVGIYPLSLWN